MLCPVVTERFEGPNVTVHLLCDTVPQDPGWPWDARPSVDSARGGADDVHGQVVLLKGLRWQRCILDHLCGGSLVDFPPQVSPNYHRNKHLYQIKYRLVTWKDSFDCAFISNYGKRQRWSHTTIENSLLYLKSDIEKGSFIF